MKTDSQPDTLPLAEALLAWSDPAHLQAVRDAESAFAPGELERLDRDLLDSITDRRMQPRRARTIHLNDEGGRLVKLERAWSSLLNAFQSMIEAEEVQLAGRMTKPELRAKPETLPCAWATEMTFDVRGAAVFIEEQRYVGVVATRHLKPEGEAAVTRTSKDPLGGSGDGPTNLLEALTRWTNPKLVEDVRVQERGHTRHEMTQVDWPLLSAPDELAQPQPNGWMVGLPSFNLLNASWALLLADFRNRLQRGEFHLTGVMAAPERTMLPVPIPGVWAADMRFEFLTGAISIDEMRYVAIVAVRGPAPDLPTVELTTVSEPRVLVPLTPNSVRALSDDEVLLLLEEHYGRIVDSPDAKMFPPGKISLTPLVKRKMEARAKSGDLAPQLGLETQWLAAWIKGKVPSHQTPSASTIEINLGSTYWLLNPRSKARIQKRDD